MTTTAMPERRPVSTTIGTGERIVIVPPSFEMLRDRTASMGEVAEITWRSLVDVYIERSRHDAMGSAIWVAAANLNSLERDLAYEVMARTGLPWWATTDGLNGWCDHVVEQDDDESYHCNLPLWDSYCPEHGCR